MNIAQPKIGRRDLVKGVAGLSALPLAAVLADPVIAKAVAAGLETVDMKTASGRTVKASLALPARTPAPAVLLVHEWWGLNDQIKSVAAELAKIGYAALAVDLYGGKSATEPGGAKALMGRVKPEEAQETLKGWVGWLQAHKAAGGKVGTVGWCFGGGWSLNASLLAPVDATVIYYGSVGDSYGGLSRSAGELKKLKGPVLGHYAMHDKWINPGMVSGFDSRMTKAGKANTSHWYDAQHGFANPTSSRHDSADAKLAWERTTAFFTENLG